MPLKREFVSEGEDLPAHRQNIVKTRIVGYDNSTLNESRLEVWYVENDEDETHY